MSTFEKFVLVDEMDLLSEEAFRELSPEQITLYLARAGVSPLDVEASLARCQRMMAEMEVCE